MINRMLINDGRVLGENAYKLVRKHIAMSLEATVLHFAMNALIQRGTSSAQSVQDSVGADATVLQRADWKLFVGGFIHSSR